MHYNLYNCVRQMWTTYTTEKIQQPDDAKWKIVPSRNGLPFKKKGIWIEKQWTVIQR